MSEFKRENRYLVIKWKDAVAALGTRELDRLQGIASAVAEHRETKGKAPLSCVVVEADWPIYERVWAEVQRLDEGKLAIAGVDENNQGIDAALAKVEDYSDVLQQRNELRALLAEANEMLGVHACNLRMDDYDEDADGVDELRDDIYKALDSKKVCDGCGHTGGGKCPDCGPVMGDATYQEMFPDQGGAA